MKKSALSIFFIAASFCIPAFAADQNVTISGIVQGYVPIQSTVSTNSHLLQATPVNKKLFAFEHVILSSKAKKYLAEHADDDSSPDKALAMTVESASPSQVQLGMNGVPVLDQGQHGTCVTFATTGALDAVLGHTDYISQLCNLELGAYLEHYDEEHPSGWDGSYNEIVLDQIKKYGIITQDFQKTHGCAQVYAYPVAGEDTGRPMKISDFVKSSKKIMDHLSWQTLLSSSDALSSQKVTAHVLANTKKAISHGHRVIFGVLVDTDETGLGIIAGHYKVPHDTFVVSNQVSNDVIAGTIQAAHALIITGYDDMAVVKDSDNVSHKGVLTLRNSWGSNAGDQGTYYMSYDYFKLLLLEAEELIPSA